MFSGIIDHPGEITKMGMTPGGRFFEIQTGFREFKPGESIAVDGVCLTLTDFGQDWFRVELSPETLKRTHLGEKKLNEKVNLERALKVEDRLGGHWVTGHVDQCAIIKGKKVLGDFVEFEVHGVSGANTSLVVEKGSICVDGVSLTINELSKDATSFKLMLIPHTLQRTTLGNWKVGDRVNVEFDWVNKVIIHHLNQRSILQKITEGTESIE